MKAKSPNVATLTTKGKKIALTLATESIELEDGAQLSKVSKFNPQEITLFEILKAQHFKPYPL